MIKTQYLVPMNLSQLMRTHKVTIADLARNTGITQKRIREIRNTDQVSYHTFIDLRQAVTGEKPSKSDMVRFHDLSARGIL